jgi:hypothetical protein
MCSILGLVGGARVGECGSAPTVKSISDVGEGAIGTGVGVPVHVNKAEQYQDI